MGSFLWLPRFTARSRATYVVTASVLLHGDGFGEVTGLVDVVALGRGQLAGEDLERHGRHQRLQQSGHGRDADERVSVRCDGLVAFLGDHVRTSAAGPDLLDVGDDLVVEERARSG